MREQQEDLEFDPREEARRREAEEEARIARRIRRELIRVDSGEADEDMAREREAIEREREQEQERERRQQRRSRSLLWQVFSGSFLVGSGATQYYNYLIAMAAMCLVSIFVTFMSLNADMECRNLEEQVRVLRERAVLMQEQRFRRGSYNEIMRMLEDRGIRMTDLSDDSRLIER
ncbi:MAG: hypothetical protein K2J31_05860 [Alistipes sp.]|nr:hypothetical protein [Alistipes sp.]MDE6862247.1 hypothetical protein [Alistipes sp.]